MARYIGPRSKKARGFGEPIYGYDPSFEKKKYAPGQHGNSKRRRTKSEYAIQLMEKQKAKYTYGVLERQFRNLFETAAHKTGVTGVILMQMLESRLDNVVFRLGIAPSRRGARQLVGHRHIEVNGKVVNVPSFHLRPGDIVSVRERSKALESVLESLERNTNAYAWLEWDVNAMSGKLVELPERDKIPETIREQLIVELYSK